MVSMSLTLPPHGNCARSWCSTIAPRSRHAPDVPVRTYTSVLGAQARFRTFALPFFWTQAHGRCACYYPKADSKCHRPLRSNATHWCPSARRGGGCGLWRGRDRPAEWWPVVAGGEASGGQPWISSPWCRQSRENKSRNREIEKRRHKRRFRGQYQVFIART